MSLDFWYDQQLKRFLLHFGRVFSNFNYMTGQVVNGQPLLRPVPCRMALMDRQVAHIMRNNSENTMLTVPMITYHLRDIEIDRSRTQYGDFTEKVQITEREYDQETDRYGSNPGNRYQLTRQMPVPYNLIMEVNVWTSNFDQKAQLFEQLAIFWNPSLDLQTSDNPLDWTALKIIELEGCTWSSRAIPIGPDNEIDIMTFTVKCPWWLSAPAKLSRQKLIHQIITNIKEVESYDELESLGEGTGMEWSSEELLARIVTTPNDNVISVNGTEITLLGPGGLIEDEDGNPYSWEELIKLYGAIRNNISQLRLRFSENPDDNDVNVIGNISLDPTQPNKLYWMIDASTLPSNTLTNINAVINPHNVFPGHTLPIATTGQRYLLTDDLGPNSQGWGDITAKVNDIIEYNGTKWTVSFEASSATTTEVVLNLASQKQLKYVDNEWVMAIDGEYPPGMWRLYL